MRNSLSKVIAAFLTAFLLTACGGPFNGNSDNPMGMLLVAKNPDAPSGPRLSTKQVEVITKYARSCYAQMSAQLSGVTESAFVSGFWYMLGGAIGGGLGLGGGSQFFPGTDIGQYAGYGAVAGAGSGAGGGAINGAVTHSYAMVSAVGTCVSSFVADQYAGVDMGGVHVTPSYVRSEGIPSEMIGGPAPSGPVPLTQ